MIKDHSKANEELKAIAKSKRIALPAEMGAEEQKIKTQLADQSGIAFDKAYIDAMVKDHRKDIKSFQDGKKIIHYEELTAFIDKTLPVLKMHYDAVQKLQGKIK
jgi:putative membrane protein